MTCTGPNSDALAYFATPGPLTDLVTYAARVRALPDALPDLCRVVQGLVVHPFLSHLYGLAPATLRHDELEMRAASEQRFARYLLAKAPTWHSATINVSTLLKR